MGWEGCWLQLSDGHVLSVSQRGGGGGGDALGGCPCREVCEGCPCDAGRLEQGSSAPSLIKQLFPRQQAISPALAPGVMGLPASLCQLSYVEKQVRVLSCQSHTVPVGLGRETGSDSIHAGRNQPVEAMRSPGQSPTAGEQAARVTPQGKVCVSQK